ncbi:MAG: TldD/PmbA family protein [Nitrospirae bacterium]|nr:MAG: TldD/PmbA family protein [Nitrospirota bacterium]
MVSLPTLKRTAEQGLRYLRRQKDIQEAEVFVASNAGLTARVNYTSHIPCNGVEEPKSTSSHGLGVRAVFQDPRGPRIGLGSEAGDLSLNGVKAALEKARRSAVHDPDFTTLPRPSPERRTLTKYHDPSAMTLTDTDLVQAGWRVLTRALDEFAKAGSLSASAQTGPKLRELGFIVGGDVTVLLERMAMGSTRLPKVQTDESTLIASFITAMVEREGAKGTGSGCHTRLSALRGDAGAEAARNALSAVGGVRIKDGAYAVVLGPQPVTELMSNLILPSLTVASFYDCSSAFHGKLGRQVAHHDLTIYDHGALPGHMGSKGITCEGLPTGRTDLIADGKLVGLLSSFYETERMLRDPAAKEKLGVPPEDCPGALVPRNGFRFAGGGGRRFDIAPSVAPTNVFIEGPDKKTREDLLRQVQNGVYIGRIWYTYPINGLRTGDFTATVVGDSYMIKDGKLAAPIKANVLRINDNIHQVLQNIVGITSKSRGTIIWAADEVVYAPEIAVARLRLTEIAGFLDAH